MEEKELKNGLQTVIAMSEIAISSKEDVEAAGTVIHSLDDMIKRVVEYWKGPKDAAFKAHKEITAKEGEMLKPLKDHRNDLAKRVSVFLTEQERIRREAQRKLDDERRAEEEAERKRLESLAKRAEKRGNEEKAGDLRDQAAQVYIPPAVVEPLVDKTTRIETGTISQKKDIEVEIVDMAAFLKAVVAGDIPIGVVNINLVKVKAYIKVAGLPSVPGLSIREVVGIVSRAK